MKLYFATIDEFGNVHSSVSTGTPMDLLKQVFVSLPTGEFDLSNRKIADRVEEVDQLFAETFNGLETPVEVINMIAKVLTYNPVDEEVAETLAEMLLIDKLVEDGPELVDFLDDLRNIFNGTEYDLNATNDMQTSVLIVRIEM